MDPPIPMFDNDADLRELATGFDRAGIVRVRRAIDTPMLARLRGAAAHVLSAVAEPPTVAFRAGQGEAFNRVPFVLALEPDSKPFTALLANRFVAPLSDMLLRSDRVG